MVAFAGTEWPKFYSLASTRVSLCARTFSVSFFLLSVRLSVRVSLVRLSVLLLLLGWFGSVGSFGWSSLPPAVARISLSQSASSVGVLARTLSRCHLFLDSLPAAAARSLLATCPSPLPSPPPPHSQLSLSQWSQTWLNSSQREAALAERLCVDVEQQQHPMHCFFVCSPSLLLSILDRIVYHRVLECKRGPHSTQLTCPLTLR